MEVRLFAFKMKRIYWISLLMVCLVVTATAGIVLENEIILDKIFSDELKIMNIDEYNSFSEEQDGLYRRRIEKDICEDIIIPTLVYNESIDGWYVDNITVEECTPKIHITSQWFNKSEKRDEWENKKLIDVANTSINRKNKNNIEIIISEEIKTVKDKIK